MMRRAISGSIGISQSLHAAFATTPTALQAKRGRGRPPLSSSTAAVRRGGAATENRHGKRQSVAAAASEQAPPLSIDTVEMPLPIASGTMSFVNRRNRNALAITHQLRPAESVPSTEVAEVGFEVDPEFDVHSKDRASKERTDHGDRVARETLERVVGRNTNLRRASFWEKEALLFAEDKAAAEEAGPSSPKDAQYKSSSVNQPNTPPPPLSPYRKEWDMPMNFVARTAHSLQEEDLSAVTGDPLPRKGRRPAARLFGGTDRPNPKPAPSSVSAVGGSVSASPPAPTGDGSGSSGNGGAPPTSARERYLAHMKARLADNRVSCIQRDFYNEVTAQIAARKLLKAQASALPTAAEQMAYIHQKGRLLAFTKPMPLYGFAKNATVQVVSFKAPGRVESRAVDAISAAGRAAVARNNVDERYIPAGRGELHPDAKRSPNSNQSVFKMGALPQGAYQHKLVNSPPTEYPDYPQVPVPSHSRDAVVEEALAFGQRLDAMREAAEAKEGQMDGGGSANNTGAGAGVTGEGEVQPKRRGRPPSKATPTPKPVKKVSAAAAAKAAKGERVDTMLYADIYDSAAAADETMAEGDAASSASPTAVAMTIDDLAARKVEADIDAMHICTRFRVTIDLNESAGISKSGKSVNIAICKSPVGHSNIRLMLSVFRQVAVSAEEARQMFVDAASTVEAIVKTVEAQEAMKAAALAAEAGAEAEEAKQHGDAVIDDASALSQTTPSTITTTTTTEEELEKAVAAAEPLLPALSPMSRLGVRIPFIEGIGYEVRYDEVSNRLHLDIFPRAMRIGTDSVTRAARLNRWAPLSTSGRSHVFARSTMNPRNLLRTPFACAITVLVPCNARIDRAKLADYFGLRSDHPLMTSFFGAAGSLESVSPEESAQIKHNTLTELYGLRNLGPMGGSSGGDSAAIADAPSKAVVVPAHHRQQRMWEDYLLLQGGLEKFTEAAVHRAAVEVIGLVGQRIFGWSGADIVDPSSAWRDEVAAAVDEGSDPTKKPSRRIKTIPQKAFNELTQLTIQRLLDTAGSNFRAVYALETHMSLVATVASSLNGRNGAPENDLSNSFGLASNDNGAGSASAPAASAAAADGSQDGEQYAQLAPHLQAALSASRGAFQPIMGSLAVPMLLFKHAHFALMKRWVVEGLELAGLRVGDDEGGKQ